MNWNIEPTTRRRLTLNLDSFPTIFPVDLMTIMICASIVGSITGHSRHGKSGSAKTQTPNWFWTVSGNYLSLVELESSSWYGIQGHFNKHLQHTPMWGCGEEEETSFHSLMRHLWPSEHKHLEHPQSHQWNFCLLNGEKPFNYSDD